MTKRCSRCQCEKPLAEFGRNKRKADGYHYYCKSCVSQAKREYYLRHSDRVKANVAAYLADNPEAARERRRQYYIRHAEQIKERARRWAQDNRERLRERRKAYRQQKPEVWRKNNMRRRAWKKAATVVGDIDFDAILERDGGRCWICGEPVSEEDMQFDHAVPLSKGGEHSTRNVRVAHRFCNYSKHDKLIEHQMYLL